MANSKLISRSNDEMKAKEHRLGFETKDVKYIVVRTEGEIKRFAEFIQNSLSDETFKENEKNLLISKLISAEQIKEDM